MKLSKKGENLIKRYEGLRLNAYICPAGVPSIGYGHTKNVRIGDVITEEQANQFFVEDALEVSNLVYRLLKKKPTQGQFDAMVSLAYNIGIHNFEFSKVLEFFNLGDIEGAANNFQWWRRVGGHDGKIVEGLVERRQAEKELFLS